LAVYPIVPMQGVAIRAAIDRIGSLPDIRACRFIVPARAAKRR
jgi:hypothetical protein